MKTAFSLSKYILEHIIEVSECYEGIISLADIEKFKKMATEYDQEYISELISKCTTWTLKKDWDDKYNEKLKRDEIKVLERVKFRVERSE